MVSAPSDVVPAVDGDEVAGEADGEEGADELSPGDAGSVADGAVIGVPLLGDGWCLPASQIPVPAPAASTTTTKMTRAIRAGVPAADIVRRPAARPPATPGGAERVSEPPQPLQTLPRSVSGRPHVAQNRMAQSAAPRMPALWRLDPAATVQPIVRPMT